MRLPPFAQILLAWTLTITGVTATPGPPPTITATFTVTDDGGATVRTSTITVPSTMTPQAIRQSLQYQLQITKDPIPPTPASTPVLSGETFSR